MALLAIPFFIYAEDDSKGAGRDSGLYEEQNDAAADKKSPSPRPGWIKSETATLRSGRRESRRYFELGILNLNAGLLGLDIDGVLSGSLFDFGGFDPTQVKEFSADMYLFTKPVYFRVSLKESFDLDFFTGADFSMAFDLPQKTVDSLAGIMDAVNTPPPSYTPGTPLTQNDLTDYNDRLKEYMDALQSIDADMSAGVSMFMELGMGVSKTLLNDRLYLRTAPSLFFALMYMEHSTAGLRGYSDTTNNKYGLQGEGGMTLYSAWDLAKDPNPFASPGFDITLEARYALFSFLDTGFSVSHIPVLPAKLNHGKSIDASDITMTVKAPADTQELGELLKNPDSAVNINVPSDNLLRDSKNENKTVIRPTSFDFYVLLKPFKSPLLVVRPKVGLTINSVVAPALVNWDLDFQFNAPRIFSVFAGTGLTENVWTQRAGVMLDFHAFEVDVGAALTGKTFAECFSDRKGLSLGIGLKLGF
jgi:hypothetical protein